MSDKKAPDLRKFTPGPWEHKRQPFKHGVWEMLYWDNVYNVTYSHSLSNEVYAANFALMAAAPDLVRELARTILEIMNHVDTTGMSGVEVAETLSKGGSHQALVKALQCQPADLTLEALKIIAEGE